MYSIRNLRASDKEDVRRICIETASASATDTPSKRAILCDLYCDYYVEYACDTSFVARIRFLRARLPRVRKELPQISSSRFA